MIPISQTVIKFRDMEDFNSACVYEPRLTMQLMEVVENLEAVTVENLNIPVAVIRPAVTREQLVTAMGHDRFTIVQDPR